MEDPMVLFWFLAKGLMWLVIGIFTICILKAGLFTVQQQTRVIIERLGRFHRVAEPGLRFKWPIIDKKVAVQNMKTQQLVLRAETKTKDNVFVHVAVATQYRILPGSAAESHYMLQDVDKQMAAYILDVVRAKVPANILDEAYEKKDELAHAVKDHLAVKMGTYGFEIIDALVTEIEPDAKVKASMNEIQAQTRLRVAAQEKGEADKVLVVKRAEAEAESKKLQGEGLANQRKAIINGLKESIEEFEKGAGVDTEAALQMVLLTQYFDTLKEFAMSEGSKVILMPNSLSAVRDLSAQIRDGMIAGEEASSAPVPKKKAA